MEIYVNQEQKGVQVPWGRPEVTLIQDNFETWQKHSFGSVQQVTKLNK